MRDCWRPTALDIALRLGSHAMAEIWCVRRQPLRAYRTPSCQSQSEVIWLCSFFKSKQSWPLYDGLNKLAFVSVLCTIGRATVWEQECKNMSKRITCQFWFISNGLTCERYTAVLIKAYTPQFVWYKFD